MVQLSKLKKSRDKWRDKAKKRSKEIWEMRKVHKYYKDRVAKLIEENSALNAKLKEMPIENNREKKTL